MVKTKNKNVYVPLVVTGYTLFTLLVITTLSSTTIPLGILLFNPKVLHYNVTMLLVALTAGALLPVIVGYYIGDNSVKTKSKLSHHFAGMLFGLFAFLIMILPSTFTILSPVFSGESREMSLAIHALLPSVCIAVIATIISIAHVRSHKANQDILQYKPFSIAFVSLILLLLASIVQNIAANTMSFYSFVPIIFTAVLGSLLYATLHKVKMNQFEKVVWSAVSISVLLVALYVLSQCISLLMDFVIRTPTMEQSMIVSGAGVILAFVTWGIYWFKQVSALKLDKNGKK